MMLGIVLLVAGTACMVWGFVMMFRCPYLFTEHDGDNMLVRTVLLGLGFAILLLGAIAVENAQAAAMKVNNGPLSTWHVTEEVK